MITVNNFEIYRNKEILGKISRGTLFKEYLFFSHEPYKYIEFSDLKRICLIMQKIKDMDKQKR